MTNSMVQGASSKSKIIHLWRFLKLKNENVQYEEGQA